MRHLRSLVVAFVAILALGAVVTSAAQAEPKMKTESFPVKLTSEGGSGKLTAGSHEIKCTANTGKGELESATLIFITIIFTGCETEGVKCKSEAAESSEKSSTAGDIIILVFAHLTLLNNGPGMAANELYYWEILLILVLIKCGVISINVDDSVLILSSLPESIGELIMKLEGKGSEGKQEVTSCEEPTELCSEKPIELLSEFVEGKPESSVLTQTETVNFEKEVTAEG